MRRHMAEERVTHCGEVVSPSKGRRKGDGDDGDTISAHRHEQQQEQKKSMGRWRMTQAHLSLGDSPHYADHQLAQDQVERLLGIVQVDRCGIPNDKSCSAPPRDLALGRALICRLDCPNIAIHPNNLSGGHSFFRAKDLLVFSRRLA